MQEGTRQWDEVGCFILDVFEMSTENIRQKETWPGDQLTSVCLVGFLDAMLDSRDVKFVSGRISVRNFSLTPISYTCYNVICMLRHVTSKPSGQTVTVGPSSNFLWTVYNQCGVIFLHPFKLHQNKQNLERW